jgi:N-hydroxyarylamine O-acetyltransferase
MTHSTQRLSPDQIAAYARRIGWSGPLSPDLRTLKGLHRAHLLNIPYENLDVQMGRVITTDPLDAFEKIVTRTRGGWCYEMNGLFGLALESIGFKVMRMAGGVMREMRGDDAIGNHLILKIGLDEPYLADVGFGDGFVEPVPIRPHEFSQNGFQFRLENLGGDWWRAHSHPLGGAKSYDFRIGPADEDLLRRRCEFLQSNPESSFVLNAVIQKHFEDHICAMRGRTLRRIDAQGAIERLIGSKKEWVDALATNFGLACDDPDLVWPKIVARHEALFPAS